jgi:hypothetical protein
LVESGIYSVNDIRKMEGLPADHSHKLLGQRWLTGFGKATSCYITKYHNPVPLRFVWHHILPLACGGKTEAGNVVNICDSCHFAVHELMTDLKDNNGQFTIARPLQNRKRAALARQGYKRAVTAGTLDKMPNQ